MVFLDFDGVLFNTVREAYAVSMISTGKLNIIENIDFDSEHYIQFEKYRYLIGPAWNYKYLLKVLLENKQQNIETNYYDLVKIAKKKDYNLFEKAFFNTRKQLQKNDFQKWLKLNTSYPFLLLIKKLLINYKNNFIIVTTKDKDTVYQLLQLENIIFDKKAIYDKYDFEKYTNKSEIIKMLMTSMEITNAIFIDDSRKHLESCLKIKNLELFQASWGYISSKDLNTFSDKEIFSKILKEGIN